MKNISHLQKKHKNKNAEIIRIQKLTNKFRSSGRLKRSEMLADLRAEINHTQDKSVKGWLTSFEGVLKQMNGRKTGGSR